MALQTLEIVELPVDDPAAVDAAHRIADEAIRSDAPDLPPECRYAFGMQLVHPRPGADRQVFLAHRDGEPVGTVALELPTRDNLDKAHIEVSVPVGLRGRGIGRALYAHAAGLARDRGRTSALSFSPLAPAPSGFAAAMGLQNGLTDARRKLRIADLDEPSIQRLYDESLAKSPGYTAEQWIGMPPERLIADLAGLDSSFLAEAPMGELDYEPQNIDVELLRAQHEAYVVYDSRRYQSVVIHEATGRVVAWSAIRVRRTVREHAWQLITLVHPAHRGHRLGLRVKVDNLRFLLAHEPVATIHTFNAVENSHMIAINEAMGFRLAELWANWQGAI
ncbi:GNAT family N-acetyltransferase [Dactylosporangium sp. CA-092794]|uniref:GNAT family N-acetyltransferase n=1 Tax=Dactylosporangium sp. CA-092794 TaxID=3239929 RepID=UPI003D9098CE